MIGDDFCQVVMNLLSMIFYRMPTYYFLIHVSIFLYFSPFYTTEYSHLDKIMYSINNVKFFKCMTANMFDNYGENSI